MKQRDPKRVLPARLSDIVLQYSSEEGWAEGGGELELWHVRADVATDAMDWELEGEGVSHVGDFEFIVADPFKTRDLWTLLNDYSSDTAVMADALMDPDRGDVWEHLQGFGTGVLILSRASLTEAWLGYGVGAALVGKAIRRLGDGCCGAVCFPAPLPRRGLQLSEDEYSNGHAALAKTWGRLGFESYRDGVMILDLGLQLAEDRLNQCIAEAEKLAQPDRFG